MTHINTTSYWSWLYNASVCSRIGLPVCTSSSASAADSSSSSRSIDVLVRQHHQLLELELARLAQDLAENLVAHRLRRLDEAAALAGWTRHAQHVFQALARALARHLDQAERRHRRDVVLGVVAGQRFLQRLQHLLAVLLLLHVDEVDDDDAAEVAQPQLARDRHRRLEVGAEDRLLERAVADVRAGVDVDRRHRLGLVEDQVAAGLQRHLAVERLLDLLLDAVQVEDRPVAVVQLDALAPCRA